MSVRVETLIEGGDFDYDIDNIQELDHFDIGEEEDPEEVTAGEAGVWANPLERVPLSRQKPRRVPKRSGRKRKGEVIRIPKRQPPREAKRIKSYQQFDTFEDDEGEEDQEDVEEEDSDPEIMDEHGEPSTSKTFRVFVRKDGTGMHYDWPIYSDTAISLKDVVSIISSEASGIEKICSDGTIPQEFTNTGTFICQMGDTVGRRKEEICNDGLGTWQSAQMFVRKYIVGGERQRPQMTQKNDHNLKIVCEQFIHPGTDSRGDFLRKIYTGFDKDEHMMSYVVISYEWMGQPHPLTVYEEDDSSSSPTSHGDKIQALQDQMTWKKCSNPDDQVPILARHACDFTTMSEVLKRPTAAETDDDLLEQQEAWSSSKKPSVSIHKMSKRPKTVIQETPKHLESGEANLRFELDLEGHAPSSGILYPIRERPLSTVELDIEEFRRFSKDDGFPEPLDLSAYFKKGRSQVVSGRSFFAQEFDRVQGNLEMNLDEEEELEEPEKGAEPDFHVENEKLLKSMDPEKIREMQTEIQERFDPKIMEFLKNRSKNPQKPPENPPKISKFKAARLRKGAEPNGKGAELTEKGAELPPPVEKEVEEMMNELEVLEEWKDREDEEKYNRLATDAIQMDLTAKFGRNLAQRQQKNAVKLFDNCKMRPEGIAPRTIKIIRISPEFL
uniref:RPAP1_N domain-containing protein n=1 Tax=Caenorhabditis tropicalis TaxID=1561998 RepID=A0A1I7UZ10_9PELO